MGAPILLGLFLVLIELVRRVIRPITLTVRLMANLVAGHLILSLIRVRSGQGISLTIIKIIRAMAVMTLLCVETGVALIQAYVFTLLRALYVQESEEART